MELIYQQGGKNAKSYFLEYYRKNYQGGLPSNIESIINNNKAISLKNKRDGMFSLIDNELDNESKKTTQNLHDKFFARIYGQNVKNRISKINESSKAILDKYIELFNKKSKNNTYMNNSNSNSNNNNNKNNNSFLNNASISSNNNNSPSDLPVLPNNTPNNTPNDPSNKANNNSNNNSNNKSNNKSNNNSPLGLPEPLTNKPNEPTNMSTNMANNMANNMASNNMASNNSLNSTNATNATNVSNNTTLPNNNSSNFEMTANSLKTFEDEDNMLQKKVRHIGENLEKLSLFSNVIDNAIAKITELNERIALLTSNNGDKQEIAKLSKEKEKLMKLLVNIDGLLNEKTSNMNSKVERLRNLVEQSNPNARNMVGGKKSKKNKRNMKHKKTMKNRRTRKH